MNAPKGMGLGIEQDESVIEQPQMDSRIFRVRVENRSCIDEAKTMLKNSQGLAKIINIYCELRQFQLGILIRVRLWVHPLYLSVVPFPELKFSRGSRVVEGWERRAASSNPDCIQLVRNNGGCYTGVEQNWSRGAVWKLEVPGSSCQKTGASLSF
ncbi:hypothetical protein TNCV_4414481 [Trichonephila clavipes]|uniref:Uncharacterized protein n=1 Tax=Trichonephila clavipes TaxID=2585209 RepID=A0A8X6S4C1_TRICX|nr:hypothetical protein TNCV_4414481 [Trichonephila clavipes]